MARRILARYRSLQGLGSASQTELAEMTGLDSFEILRANALIELGRRYANSGKGPVTAIEGPEDVFELLDHLKSEKKEHFVAVLLDAKNKILRTAVIHIGTLTSSVVGPREVFREAIRDGASSIIVAHNHPSGDPTPSPEDFEVTKLLVEVGEILDIPVLDHVIIGERGFRSLQRIGKFG